MFVCWDCEKICPTNDAHGFTRVLCPWCFDQHRHYRRMVDLRQHVKNSHPTIFKKEGDVPFLKEKSDFYLADNPKEYRRAMCSVPLDVTPAALFLKEAVEDWCINFKGVVDRPLTTWRQLWTQFGRIFSPEQEPSLDYGYTPTRPDLDTVYSIDLEATGATAVMYGTTRDGCSAFRKITFTDKVINDAKKRPSPVRTHIHPYQFSGRKTPSMAKGFSNACLMPSGCRWLMWEKKRSVRSARKGPLSQKHFQGQQVTMWMSFIKIHLRKKNTAGLTEPFHLRLTSPQKKSYRPPLTNQLKTRPRFQQKFHHHPPRQRGRLPYKKVL